MTVYKPHQRWITTATFSSALREKPPAMKLHATAFLAIFWLGVFALHVVKGSIGSQSMRKLSCVTLSTQKVDIRNLVNYEKQQTPVEAVMFITAKGIKICVHPDQRWVQTAIRRIDARRSSKKK